MLLKKWQKIQFWNKSQNWCNFEWIAQKHKIFKVIVLILNLASSHLTPLLISLKPKNGNYFKYDTITFQQFQHHGCGLFSTIFHKICHKFKDTNVQIFAPIHLYLFLPPLRTFARTNLHHHHYLYHHHCSICIFIRWRPNLRVKPLQWWV